MWNCRCALVFVCSLCSNDDALVQVTRASMLSPCSGTHSSAERPACGRPVTESTKATRKVPPALVTKLTRIAAPAGTSTGFVSTTPGTAPESWESDTKPALQMQASPPKLLVSSLHAQQQPKKNASNEVESHHRVAVWRGQLPEQYLLQPSGTDFCDGCSCRLDNTDAACH